MHALVDITKNGYLVLEAFAPDILFLEIRLAIFIFILNVALPL